MVKLKITTIMFLFAFSLFDAVAVAKPASVMLREGLYAEEVEGDIDAAIKIYEQIIQDSSASRNHVAQALYRQGMCYLKKKNDSQARVVFGKLVAEYGDQTDIIEKVKPFLDDLANYDPADLMPPETLIYIELGSPGKQIETILNMLKGTPFENPLAAISGPSSPGDKSPQDILAALLNPSMMAEFKKIRGMAVGVTDIAQNNPPLVIVLFPGKSDALRGIILAGLGMMGQRSEPIEGMEIINIQNSASVAYDDKVIIIAQPPQKLQWCIKQHKGVISEPTLASSNKSFTKVSKKIRQDNALTVWANVDQVYSGISKLFPEDKKPKEMLLANSFADFNNIDDLLMYSSIEEDGFTYRADVLFRDGHHCLAYDMIRTPNLNKACLKAVPSDATAIISVALGQADGNQVKAVSEKIQNVTGLDIGREIFANIEQIALFAMPSDGAFTSGPPFLQNMGLSVTSHNPQQTRQILMTLLRATNLLASGQQANEISTPSDRYQVDLVNNRKLYCYTDQMNKATMLSLNKNITDACVSAIKQGKSVCTAGPLKNSIDELSPTVSKLALVNVGGAIRVAAPAIVESCEQSQREQLQNNLQQLAQAAEKTTIELRTDEQINNFSLYAALNDLPPLNEILGPATEISQVIDKAKAKARAKSKQAKIVASIVKATKSPRIDGTEEDLWSAAKQYKLDNVIYSPISSDEDFSAYYKAMWDEKNLYMLVDVTDDELTNDSGSAQWYQDDCIEVFIDADNSKSDKYDENDYQYHFDWDKSNPKMDEDEHGKTDNVEFAMVTTEKGYRTEIKFPWSTLGTKPSAGVSIGLEVHVNDDDKGERTKLAWRNTKDTASGKPQTFGTAKLAGLVGWWKFDDNVNDSACSNNGTEHGGPTYGTGKDGQAISFDGIYDYITVPDSPAIELGNGSFSIALWLKSNWEVGSEKEFIICNGTNGTEYAGASGKRYVIKLDSDDFRFAIDDDKVKSILDSPGENFATGDWIHAVVVRDAEAQELRMYRNGVLKGTKANVDTEDVSSPGEPLFIGAKQQEGANAGSRGEAPIDHHFKGMLDDVRIYNYALKEADIMALYNKE